MLKPVYTNKILKDIKLAQKRGLNLKKLKDIVELLCENRELPKQCKLHILSGKCSNYWECHIAPDWLLIYKFVENEIHLIRTGTQSDLF